jgi:sugar/nucleoside kinase (ribokinase family)
MKIGIFSHIVLDSIKDTKGFETESLGGPSCYGSIVAKTLNLNAVLFTKMGQDYYGKKIGYLRKNGVEVDSSQVDNMNPTTKFRLILHPDGSRDVFLLSKCSPIDIAHLNTNNLDGIVLSPVFDEISEGVFQILRNTKKDKFTMLDPQGFLRHWNTESLQIAFKKRLDIDISGITAIKADECELSVLTNGITGIDGIRQLKKKYNLDFVISTGNNQISLLHKKIVYTIDLKQRPNIDSTGLGDILTAGFACSYLKEKDPLWGLCFGVGSVIAALESKSKGLEKVPRRISIIERYASYCYNTVRFKIID